MKNIKAEHITKERAGYYKVFAGTYTIYKRLYRDNKDRLMNDWRLYKGDEYLGHFRTMKDALAGLDEYLEKHKMTKEQMVEALTDEMLLKVFEEASEKFVPIIGDASCGMYEAAKAEILRRMKKEG